MTSVVITGASGFLGQTLRARLATDGFDVIAVSRRDVSGMRRVRDYGMTPAGDLLIHCAEMADRAAVNAQGPQYETRAASVVETLVERFGASTIYASSGAVYGDDGEGPFPVDSPSRATDVYTRSKIRNEEIVSAAGGSVVRLSNLVGEGMSPTNVLSDILLQIPGVAPIRVRDDQPVRDYLAVSDAAAAFAKIVVRGGRTGIVNVGSGIATSVRELAELLLGESNETGRPIIATARSTHPSFNVLDISETARILGWTPASSLRDEVRSLMRRAGALL